MCKAKLSFLFGLMILGCAEVSPELEFEQSQPDPSDEGSIVGSLEEGELLAPGSQAVPVELVIGDCPGAIRLIAVLDEGYSDCSMGDTVPAQWESSRLFESGSPGVAGLLESAPAELERYCAFDYVGTEGQVGSWYAALTTAVNQYEHIDASTLSTDCRGEFAQGDLYDVAIGNELRSAFLTNIGWDMGEDVDTEFDVRETIEVAVVDTVSQTAAVDPYVDPANAHGLQMAALIREIGCAAGRSECEDAVHHVLAMPRDDWETTPDWVAGGNHGSQGDLAMGIYEAVEAWRERRLDDPTGSSPRLVINLSIGWEPLSDEPLESERGPHASVLAAMRFASCQGALMIAAAGNTKDEMCPADNTGALAPALFENLAAPTATECAALGFSPAWTNEYPIFAGVNDYAPLVHAVGGLDEFDKVLINGRRDSMPRLAALGANGIVDPAADSLSGTSVSAAVASGTASLLWSYRPELRPDEIMQLIYDAGWATGEDADFALTGEPAVHRLSVCAALDDACDGQSGDCPTPECSATAPAADGNLSDFDAAVDAVLADPSTTVDTFENENEAQAPTCEPPAESTDLTSPQPEDPLCSRCQIAAGGFQGKDELSMTIDPAYAGQVINAKLVLMNVTGEASYIGLDSSVIASLNAQPHPTDITLVYLDPTYAESASLQFWLADGSFQSNRITVIGPPV